MSAKVVLEKRVHDAARGFPCGIAFSPDGRWVATSGDATVKLWRFGPPLSERTGPDGDPAKPIQPTLDLVGEEEIRNSTQPTMAFSPDSNLLAVMDTGGKITVFAIDRDGRKLFAKSDDADARVGTPAGTTGVYDDVYISGSVLQFSADNEWLVDINVAGVVHIWQVRRNKLKLRMTFPARDGVTWLGVHSGVFLPGTAQFLFSRDTFRTFTIDPRQTPRPANWGTTRSASRWCQKAAAQPVP